MANQPTLTSEHLVEPLTRREQDILKLLALNLTDREIADRLTLALSSVKWYARQIYAKLGVENRHQAVAKAAELDLLPRSTLSRRAHNLPRQITRLIGREKEIARVVEMIWEYSLITLTGPGGVGKTRLALAAAEELLDDFANGVWFVEIAPLSDPLLVERTIADVLGVREEPGRPLRDSLVLYLQDRQALLIFDNCEHMLDTCAALANDLLKGLPRLKVLVSSRELLGVTGEAVFRVPSLSFPDDPKPLPLKQIQEFEAVCLFQERARAALPAFQLDTQNAASVARICRRLDGIPLAIELAASRVASLDLEQIASRLDQAFRLLSGGSRGALERHRTLRAAIDWSYNLLTQKERLLLRRLTVFINGCTLEAAETVCAGEGVLKEEILDLLYQLINKSMLLVEKSRIGETRYRILETIRQYTEDKQDDPVEIERLRRLHCDWFVQLAEYAEPKLYTGERLVWTRKVEADIDNFRAALEWSLGGEADSLAGLRMINALVTNILDQEAYRAEGRCWVQYCLDRFSRIPATPLQKAKCLYGSIWLCGVMDKHEEHFEQLTALCQGQGDEGRLIEAKALSWLGILEASMKAKLHESLQMISKAEAIFREVGPRARWDLAVCLSLKQFPLSNLGDEIGAAACAKESTAIFEDVGDIWMTKNVPLGLIAFHRGDYDLARTVFEKAILLGNELHGMDDMSDIMRMLGDVYRAQGNFGKALSMYREALGRMIDTGYLHVVDVIIVCFAFTEIDLAETLPSSGATPHLFRAAHILGANQSIEQEMHLILSVEYHNDYERSLTILRERLDSTSLDAAWEEGRAMTVKQVMAYLQEFDIQA